MHNIKDGRVRDRTRPFCTLRFESGFGKLLQRLAEALVALVEETHSFHDQVVGFCGAGVLRLRGEAFQLTGVVGVVAGHILHQRVKLSHRLRGGSCVLMLVVMSVIVLVGMGRVVLMQVLVRMLVSLAVTVLVSVFMLMRVGVRGAVGMGMLVSVLVIMLVFVIGHVVSDPPMDDFR